MAGFHQQGPQGLNSTVWKMPVDAGLRGCFSTCLNALCPVSQICIRHAEPRVWPSVRETAPESTRLRDAEPFSGMNEMSSVQGRTKSMKTACSMSSQTHCVCTFHRGIWWPRA